MKKKSSRKLSSKKRKKSARTPFDNGLMENENEYFEQINVKFDTKSKNEGEASDEEFFDALSIPEDNEKHLLRDENVVEIKKRQRRVDIPTKLASSNFKVLFTILKNSIGKDLTRISFPATFFRFHFYAKNFGPYFSSLSI